MSVRALAGLALLLVPGTMESQAAPTLRLGVDSFHVSGHGLAHSQQISIERVGNGYRYVDAIALRDLMAITVTVDLTEDLAVTRVRRSGYALFGGKVDADVRYEGGRARGTAISAATRDRLIQVDTAVPPHVVDRLALLPVLLASSWEPGTSRPISLYHFDESAISEHVWTVTGRETITVPAGTFATLRGELSQADIVVWVTEAQPHRLVKFKVQRNESSLVR